MINKNSLHLNPEP